tara:strand:+ start:1564 stop:1719 length:156 start_codon:yes stop_codon:yes gene_type:complete
MISGASGELGISGMLFRHVSGPLGWGMISGRSLIPGEGLYPARIISSNERG